MNAKFWEIIYVIILLSRIAQFVAELQIQLVQVVFNAMIIFIFRLIIHHAYHNANLVRIFFYLLFKKKNFFLAECSKKSEYICNLANLTNCNICSDDLSSCLIC